METKSYVDDWDECVPASRNMKLTADGRRVQENIQTTTLEDGSEEHTHEILEEVVPMRVAKRVQRKIQPIPVEERIECIAEDGSVTTEVHAIDKNLLDLHREPLTLEQVASDVRNLRHIVDDAIMEVEETEEPLEPVRAAAPKKARQGEWTFWKRAQARYGGKRRRAVADEFVDESVNDHDVVPEAVEEEEVEVKQNKFAEFSLTTLAWIAFAVVAGLVTYALI
jgi:hypothetical protein